MLWKCVPPTCSIMPLLSLVRFTTRKPANMPRNTLTFVLGGTPICAYYGDCATQPRIRQRNVEAKAGRAGAAALTRRSPPLSGCAAGAFAPRTSRPVQVNHAYVQPLNLGNSRARIHVVKAVRAVPGFALQVYCLRPLHRWRQLEVLGHRWLSDRGGERCQPMAA